MSCRLRSKQLKKKKIIGQIATYYFGYRLPVDNETGWGKREERKKEDRKIRDGEKKKWKYMMEEVT